MYGQVYQTWVSGPVDDKLIDGETDLFSGCFPFHDNSVLNFVFAIKQILQAWINFAKWDIRHEPKTSQIDPNDGRFNFRMLMDDSKNCSIAAQRNDKVH